MLPSEPSSNQTSEIQVVEKLFRDAAGSNEEIDWIELKAILDGSIPQGKLIRLHWNIEI